MDVKIRYRKVVWQRCLLSFILLSSCNILSAQNKKPLLFKRCPVKTVNFEQGLINNTITNVITDAMGFTWVSTLTGLERYNGYMLETITPVAGNDTIHLSYPVFFLACKNNSILIGYKKGILEYSAENNTFKKIISVDPLSILHHSLVPVKETKEGIWCLQENKSIIIYNRSGIVASQFSLSDSEDIDDLVSSRGPLLKKIIVDNDDYIFIRKGLNKILQIDIRTHGFSYCNFAGGEIYGLACNNYKIFITTSTGLSCYNIKSGSAAQKILYKQITDEQVNNSNVQFSGNNRLLVSLGRHLYEFDTSFSSKKEIATLNSELIVNTGFIDFVYEDKFRRIWLLTNDDIKRIQNAEIPFGHFIYPKEKNNFVRSIYVDEEKQVLLAGCFNGGIQLYDTLGNPLWDKPLINDNVKDVVSIDKFSEGNYLIVTIGKGLYILNLATKQLNPVDLSSPSCSLLHMEGNGYPNNVQRISDSVILISTRSNVFRCVFMKSLMKSAMPLLPASEIYGHAVTCFINTFDNALWTGTGSGVIFKIDAKGSLQIINIPENYVVRSMAEDAMHNVWVGTEKGLFIYAASGKLIRQVTREKGLLNDFIYAILPDDTNNNFFVSTNLGLSFISKDGEVRNYTKELGLQENEFNTQSCAKAASGKLFFGGINGITAFYPAALSGINDTPVINITRLVVNDSLYNSSAGAWKGDSVRLAYYQNHLQFDVAATGLLNPNEYVYQYRLKAFEESWQTTHQPTGIRYTLNPGQYLLQINCSPILSSNQLFSKTIVIIIDMPWWQTWWFRVLAFGLLAASIALIALRYNHQKYQQKIRALQMQSGIQNERERISKELHDNIGTQLSYISSNVDWMLEAPVSLSREEEIKRLSAVNSTAKEMISDLRETIWAIKKESIQLDELADKLKLFIRSQRILNSKMEISIAENIQINIRFSPIEALNIFRICQEAIANAFRHAKASKLNVNIESGGKNNFSINIEDNGKGFSQNKEYHGHYGLENMRSRTEELGAKLSIISEEGKGTKVILCKG